MHNVRQLKHHESPYGMTCLRAVWLAHLAATAKRGQVITKATQQLSDTAATLSGILDDYGCCRRP